MPWERKTAEEQRREFAQADFKGVFRTEDGRYCYPLDIIDDHSCFAIRIVPYLRTSFVVIPVFTQAFQEFGLPDSILSDNGAQFAGFLKGYTQFERWLMDLDVLPIHGRIKHPQTQGKIERFHGAMKQKLLNHTTIANIEDAQNKLYSCGYARFDKWQIYLSETMRNQYIEFRPTPNGETFIACYRNFKIAKFDTENGQLIHRSIARL